MISRDKFVETMDAFTVLEKKIDNLDKALKAFCDENCLIVPDIYNILVLALETQFPQSENHWIEYFLYDTEKCGTGVLYYDDRPSIVINGWGDVYDFLISLED